MTRPFRLAVMAGALLAAALGTASAQSAPGAARFDVAIRMAPADASLRFAGPYGAALGTRPAGNGARLVSLPLGPQRLIASAPGYASAAVETTVTGPGAVLEIKLERLGTALALVAMAATDARPKSVEYTPDGRFLVVAPLSGSRVDILDARTLAVAAYAEPPARWARAQGFVESAFPAGRAELWVTQMYTDSIHVFSLADFSYLRTIPSGGSFPKVMLAHPDGRVFVSHWLSEEVVALDGATGAVLGRARTRGIPRGLALSPDGRELFVANFGNGTIECFDASTLGRTRTLFDGSGGMSKGGAKRHLVVDPVRNRLYASDMDRGSVFAYDLGAGSYLGEVRLGDAVNTNTIKLSPDGSRLYVSTRGPNNAVSYERKGPAFGEFIVIDALRLSIVERHWGGNQPTGLAVSPDGLSVVFTDFLDHRVELYRPRRIPQGRTLEG